MITARLAVTAAFAHNNPNFRTDPERTAYAHDVTVYHCMPHGGCDSLRRAVTPGAWVNTAEVHDIALHALSAHDSQQSWLENSQGMGDYLQSMEDHARAMGRRSGRFEIAEGWWRHLHLGFSQAAIDPLADALGADYLVNQDFESRIGHCG